MATPKEIAASFKEGGKKGQDLCGMNELGSISYFNTAVDSAGDSIELLEKVMEGMNTKVEEGAEERKGGADGLAKMLYSAGEKALLIVGHMPAVLKAGSNMTLAEWKDNIFSMYPGDVLYERTTESGDDEIALSIAADSNLNRFPLKMRDACISSAYALLVKKGLVKEDEDDDVDFSELHEACGF